MLGNNLWYDSELMATKVWVETISNEKQFSNFRKPCKNLLWLSKLKFFYLKIFEQSATAFTVLLTNSFLLDPEDLS